jgi:hypothetical protein
MCPDRFIRGYRLLPPAAIGKWAETAEVKCENAIAGAALFGARFFSMASQIFAAASGPAASYVDDDIAQLRGAPHRVETLQDGTSMITALAATNRRRKSIPSGI